MEGLGHANAILMLGALLVLGGILTSIVASRVGAPILLVFLILGMFAGENGPGGIQFDDYGLTYLVGSVSLAIILFDGGLRTKIRRVGAAFPPALLLASVGVIVTAGLVGLITHILLGLPPLPSFLLGSIVASTDAAAVFFLLRTGGLELKARVGNVLDVESATNDPIAVCLTIILTEILTAPAPFGISDLAAEIIREAGLGTLFGLSGGLILARAINRIELATGLYPLLMVTSAAALYAITTKIGGSGFLAVYLAGLVLGNRPIRAYPAAVSFLDVLTWLCQIVMFLMLGLLVTPAGLMTYALPALGIALFLTLVARPAAVWLCLSPFRFSTNEKLFVSWVGLRGAVSIFLAAIPTLAGVPHAEIYFNIAFVIVLASLLVQGWTITRAAERLGLALPQTGPRTTRVELDIPGQFEQELVIYPIIAGSMLLTRRTLPVWAKPVFVVRGDTVLTPEAAGAFRPGDYLYLLTPTARVDRLDRLFAGPSTSGGRPEEPAPGEFILNGDAPIAKIATLYGLDIDDEERACTVAELFQRRLDEPAEPGDLTLLGSRAVLIARKVSDGRVAQAGLQLNEIITIMLAAARKNAIPFLSGLGLRVRKLLVRLDRRRQG